MEKAEKSGVASENAVRGNTVPGEPGKRKAARWKRVLCWCAAGLFALLLLLWLLIDPAIAFGVRSIGSMVTGTRVDVGRVSLSLVHGRLEMENFTVANVPGYDYPQAVKLDKLIFDLDMGTVLSRKIVVSELVIDGCTVNFEPRVLGGSNLTDLQKNAEKFAGAEKQRAAQSGGKDAAPARKPPEILIEKFDFGNGKIAFSSSLLGTAMALPLVGVHLTDVSTGGKSLGESCSEIWGSLAVLVAGTVAKAGGSVTDGAAAAGKTTVQGVKNAGGAAAEGVSAVGSEVARGVGALGGLLTGGKK